MAVDRIRYIKEKYTVLEYARDVLGLPVRKSGDRCKSLAPGSKNPTALIVYDDYWRDFKTGAGGDVIDLCAEYKYGGDKGKAIYDLAGDYGIDYHWEAHMQKLGDKIMYFHSKLRPEDREYLHSRKINDETIERLCIGYDEDEERLIIPYQKNQYFAYYIGRDRSGKEGVSKYKKDKLDGYNENIPWGLHTLMPEHRERVKHATEQRLLNADEQTALSITTEALEDLLIIAEGAFDAMSFEQEGFRVLSPISGYFNSDALKQVINIAQDHKSGVFICFDSDAAGSKFQIKMAQTMFKHRVKFVCGKLPDGIKDVSDYYAAGGNLFELVNGATSGIEVLGQSIKDRDEFKKFIYDAARFVEEPELTELFESASENFPEAWLKSVKKKALKAPLEKMIVQEVLDHHHLKYVEGFGFYEYLHGVWCRRVDNAIRSYVASSLGYWANGSKLDTVLKYLKAETTTEEIFNRQPIFNFRNGILELSTGEFKAHNEAYMSSVQVPYDYDSEAQAPRWEQFISEIMAGREASMKLIQEMAGYILFEDCSLQKGFVLQGDGANGKSVFLNITTQVIGRENVSNVEMSSLIEPFQRINLLNSIVNISTETSTDVKGSESWFKQAVAGDEISACYKNKDFIKARPRAKMIMACNEYIKSRDTSTGFLRRLCFIDFPMKFEGDNADPDLEKKLMLELSGIFNWFYEGYKRLKQTRKFTQTAEQTEMMEEFIQISNPVAAFISEELMLENRPDVDRQELYEKYVIWAKKAGHEPQSRTKFMRNFRTTIKQLRPEVQEGRTAHTRYFDFSAIVTKAEQAKYRSAEEYAQEADEYFSRLGSA